MVMYDEQYLYNMGYADGYTEDGVSVPMKEFRDSEILENWMYKKGYKDGKKAKRIKSFGFYTSNTAADKTYNYSEGLDG